ncbi:Ig-like domain-containing protein [Azotobacter salinestris]|uniref:Ig-like domain-containing protein n=1 Tax=Azotobacter salinestris TaxID=69964 RepID=UPI0032DF9BDD
MNKRTGLLLCALGLAVATGTARAELAAVDPGPYTPATGGFPQWYQDDTGLSLELCQSKAVSPTVPGTPDAPAYLCTLLPEPGVYDDSQPMVFPDNWPPELFWFLAETDIPDNGSGFELEVYVAAVEAAFAQEQPRDGDQQSFARIRIRASVPVAGTYTITHPYGVETVQVGTAGRRAINITRDIGIGAPGDFSGALQGDIGPFLSRADGTRITAINPETGQSETFIGDPNVPTAVTGGLSGNNFVRIEGPGGRVIQTDQFTLSGKVLDARPATPLAVGRATYGRTAEGSRIDLFASSGDGDPNAELCYRETLELVDGTPPSSCLHTLSGDNNGHFFASNPPSQGLPPFVVVTARDPSGTTRPTTLSARLSDVVKIKTARYSWADRSLTIEASSSDETALPDLAAEGYGRLTKTGTLQTLSVTDLAQPPASVTVKSAAGGSDTEPVTLLGSAPVPDNQLPVAANDSATTSAGVPVTLSVLANDSDPDGNLPLSVAGLTQPAAGQGSTTLSGSTQVVYTPPATVAPGGLVATFTYRAQDARGGQSAPATVTVRVAPNQAPVAANDTASAIGNGTPVTIAVLANDSDPEGNLPLSIVNLSQPAAGQGTVATDGTQVTYTPPSGVTANFNTSFTYQARDSLGALSASASVTVAVTAPAVQENLVVQSATVARTFLGNRWSWDIRGTTNVVNGNTIRVEVDGVLLGTATPGRTGFWQVRVINSVAPPADRLITISSSRTPPREVPVTVR